MCAVVGWQSRMRAWPAHALGEMAALLAHRGPDDSGEYRDEDAGIAIAHRRLSIIDLGQASHQPMQDKERGVVLAYNGELYNYRPLRKELESRGHRFNSVGDTEVVLRAYIEWGVDCFARLAGMFAVAIWDAPAATLHLARDAMGMKPMYFLQRPSGVAFASEIKAFRALPDFHAQIDGAALTQYLEFGYVFEAKRTMLRGVKKIEAGHRVEIRGGLVAVDTAWFEAPAPDPTDARTQQRRIEEFGALMEEVVGEHLIADVPLGLLLSGGLDSSLIAALAARQGPLQTISMGFAGSDIDERANARAVSQFIGSNHTEVLISAAEVKREAIEGAWVFDDLFADWGTISTRLLYRRCRELGVKVVLVGEGADELFGGYDIFRSSPTQLGLWQQFRMYQKYAGRRHGRLFWQFRDIMREYLRHCDGDTFSAVRLFESRRQLPNQYVMKVDKASMAESVEARAPYLDRRVAEYAYRTSSEWLIRDGENKYLLRSLARDKNLLPAAASGRAKFGAALATEWMDTDAGFRAFARERVLDGGWSVRLGLRDAMVRYYDKGATGFAFPRSISLFRNLAWRILLLELWSQHYLAAD
jgi:asparagine synthase (glutamine-hydrolysing)